MHPIVRVILGVITGIIVSFVIVMCFDALSVVMFVPKGTDMTNPEVLKAVVHNMPPAAMLFVLAGWTLGAFVGVFLVTKISRNPAMGAIVGGLLLTSAIRNMMEFPHPVWMWASAITLYLLMIWLGTRLGMPRGGVPVSPAPAQA